LRKLRQSLRIPLQKLQTRGGELYEVIRADAYTERERERRRDIPVQPAILGQVPPRAKRQYYVGKAVDEHAEHARVLERLRVISRILREVDKSRPLKRRVDEEYYCKAHGENEESANADNSRPIAGLVDCMHIKCLHSDIRFLTVMNSGIGGLLQHDDAASRRAEA
jgi:hypothetical protein